MQNAKEHALAALHQGKDFIQDLLVALLTGAICGVVGSLFHLAVDWATEIRMEHNWLLYLLPVAGLVIAALYHLTKTNGIGTNNILNSIRKGHVTYIINTITNSDSSTTKDGYQIRRCAVENNVTTFTSLDTVNVLLDVLEEITMGVSTIDQ